MSTFFVTGATGSLAPFLIHHLLHEDAGHRFICLVRRPDAPDRLRHRIAAVCPACARRVEAPRVSFVDGDVTRPFEVLDRVDAVWHFAADLRMDPAAAREIYAGNIAGTQQILDFCGRTGAALYYISTAYVCGKRTGLVREDELLCGQEFRNAYEGSKAQAELMVQEWMRDHPGIVFRPSIVLGDTRTGIALAFQGLYKMVWAIWFLRERLAERTGKAGAALADLVLRIPIIIPCFSADAGINVVGAEYVTALLADLHRRPGALGRTFHLANPRPPTLETLLDLTTGIMGVRGMRLVQTSAIHVQELHESIRRLAGWLWDRVAVYCPYLMGDHPTFDMTNVALVAGAVPPHPPIDEATLHRLYSFAVARRFRDIE